MFGDRNYVEIRYTMGKPLESGIPQIIGKHCFSFFNVSNKSVDRLMDILYEEGVTVYDGTKLYKPKNNHHSKIKKS
jgi:hypothetical protein